MELTGLHILLTYTCNYECDHCFVWGSPWQTGTLTLAQLDDIFRQAKQVGSINEIYFEGGEPFLYYPILLEGVSRAKKLGFSVGIVTNGYWANRVEDAWHWLQPLVGAGLDRLEFSLDDYHGDGNGNGQSHPARQAAQELFLAIGTIAVDPPAGERNPEEAPPGLPLTGGGVMFRGRAVERLTAGLPRRPWESFNLCPYESLDDPGRLHLDPLGNLHACQGVVIGNLFERPLKVILADYQPEEHPIVGPILEGGPAALVRAYDLPHEAGYVDACHLCYRAREELRPRFPAILGPDQMYGSPGA